MKDSLLHNTIHFISSERRILMRTFLCATLMLVVLTSESFALPVRPVITEDYTLIVLCPENGVLHCSLDAPMGIKTLHRQKLLDDVDDWMFEREVWFYWIAWENTSPDRVELKFHYFGL